MRDCGAGDWEGGREVESKRGRGKNAQGDDKGDTEKRITVKKCLPPLLDQFDHQRNVYIIGQAPDYLSTYIQSKEQKKED
jgi:hypothetical protein